MVTDNDDKLASKFKMAEKVSPAVSKKAGKSTKRKMTANDAPTVSNKVAEKASSQSEVPKKMSKEIPHSKMAAEEIPHTKMFTDNDEESASKSKMAEKVSYAVSKKAGKSTKRKMTANDAPTVSNKIAEKASAQVSKMAAKEIPDAKMAAKELPHAKMATKEKPHAKMAAKETSIQMKASTAPKTPSEDRLTRSKTKENPQIVLKTTSDDSLPKLPQKANTESFKMPSDMVNPDAPKMADKQSSAMPTVGVVPEAANMAAAEKVPNLPTGTATDECSVAGTKHTDVADNQPVVAQMRENPQENPPQACDVVTMVTGGGDAQTDDKLKVVTDAEKQV